MIVSQLLNKYDKNDMRHVSILYWSKIPNILFPTFSIFFNNMKIMQLLYCKFQAKTPISLLELW